MLQWRHCLPRRSLLSADCRRTQAGAVAATRPSSASPRTLSRRQWSAKCHHQLNPPFHTLPPRLSRPDVRSWNFIIDVYHIFPANLESRNSRCKTLVGYRYYINFHVRSSIEWCLISNVLYAFGYRRSVHIEAKAF